MNRKPLIAAASLLWLGTLACAYLVGRSSGGASAQGEGGENPIKPQSAPGSRLSALGGGAATSESSGAAPDSEPPEDGRARALAQLKDALANPNPVARMRLFMETLAMMELDDYGAVLEALEPELRNGESRREIGLLLYAWAEKDGAGALAHLDSVELGREGWSLYQSALTAWGGSDPEAAASWALEKHTGKENNENYYMVSVIKGLAQHDVQRAGQLAEEIGYGRARGDALGTVVDELFKQGDDAAMQWIDSLADGDERFRAGAAGRVASQLARKDPQVAADWVMGLEIGEKDRAVGAVAETWGWKAPEEAAGWVAGIEDSKLRGQGIEAVVESWARKDPNAAGAWLGQIPASPELDRPLRTYAFMVRERDPAAAISWANTIGDEKMRGETIERIGGEWLRKSPEEAKAFLQEQPNVPEGLQRFLN